MSLSAAEIGAVLAEIRPLVLGGRIQKISQPTDCGIVLEIRSPGRTIALLLSADPDTARVHILTGRLPNPPQPPVFCQLLRARLTGAIVTELRQIEHDRVVELSLQAGGRAYLLVGELIGRGANLLLADAERTILATARPARERIQTSLPRPADRASPPTTAPPQERRRFLPEAGTNVLFPISQAIESTYGLREQEAIRASARTQRQAGLRRQAKKLARRAEALEADLVKAHRYAEYARYGELLKANLGRMGKGQSEVVLVDYFDEALPQITLPLDAAKSPRANMEDYFQKYRKFLTAQREIAPRLAATRRELETVQTELRTIETGTWTPPAAPLASPPHLRRPTGSAPQSDVRRGPFRRFQSTDGYPIYVGRNAHENEELTHRFAHSEDLWLHARGVPGSHVVVRLPKGTDVPPETLRDAATLALLYSDLKKSGKGDVIYTRKKWVRKAKGQAAGTVLVTQEQSVYVSTDRARLERMKARGEAGER